ncbi:MAG: hypothetical protein ABEH81_06005 [Halopenitus sp.]
MTEAGPFVIVADGLLVGGIATYVAARLVAGARSYTYAAVTALFGASGWGVAVLLLGAGSPGSWVVLLLVWVAVVKWRYRETWTRAASIGFVAWAAVLVGLALLTPSASGAVLGSIIR